MGLAEIMPSHTDYLSPEILIPRLGDFLVDLGIITKQDLDKALVIQATARTNGANPLLGQILIEMGIITREQLDDVITKQIVSLRDALQKANQSLEVRVQRRTHELEAAYEKLTELDRLKGNFVQNISHELRTPLTHIKGYVELLRSKELGEINADQQQALDVMSTSSDRLEKLIEDLIMFSLMDQKKSNLTFHKYK